AAWRRAVVALAVFRPDGRLNDRPWAEAELRAAVADLPGPRWAKVRRQLLDERSLTFLDRLHEEFAVAAPRAAVRGGVVAVWRGRAGEGQGWPRRRGQRWRPGWSGRRVRAGSKRTGGWRAC